MKANLVVDPFQKAFDRRNPAPGLILHSDRAGQYVSTGLKKLVTKYQLRQSMSRADDPYDNAFAESFFARFKAELLEDGAFLNIEDTHTEIFDFIEMYYNRIGRHSYLGYKIPMNFEALYYQNYSFNSQE